MVDVKKLIESAQRVAESGTTRDWTATGVRVGGVDFGTVTTQGREDTLDFIETLRAAAATQPGAPRAVPVQESEAKPLLSEAIADHLRDLTRRQLSPDTITESKHSLRILLGVAGDIPVDKVKAPQIRAFWDAVRWRPANAAVKPQYRDLSVAEIIERGKAEVSRCPRLIP